jgi:glycerophosphoryl diester phosphodiesterase
MKLSCLTQLPIAHRGLHDVQAGIVENTVSAFRLAVEADYAIECDVQLSRDGEVMVFHDAHLERLTTQTGNIADYTSSALAALNLRGSDDYIPTLTEILNLIQGKTPLIIELKSHFDGDTRLGIRVAELIKAYKGFIALKSFDPAMVSALRALVPHIPRGIVAQADYDEPEWNFLNTAQKHSLANLLHLPQNQPDFISYRAADLPNLPQHVKHLPILAWTIRNKEQQQKALLHADQIIFEGFRS